MSVFLYIASAAPLGEYQNPHHKLISVNEALALGMEGIPDHMLAPRFDRDAPGVMLWSDAPIKIEIIDGRAIVDDGGFDDDFVIFPVEKMADFLTEKEFCSCLELSYTEGRANRLIEYLREQLEYTDEVELWHLWLSDDFTERTRTTKIPADELTARDIKELLDIDVWQEPRTHYCLTICR